jgi:serine kinase of HPr protein (carbohydrate metabolism regulator)
VLVGARAVLIRGAAGSGKSRLALALIEAAQENACLGGLRFARLVGDDRVHVEAAGARLLVRPAPSLAGLIEVRSLGIRRLAHEGVAVVGWVIDLAAADAQRLPAADQRETVIAGVRLPRLAVASGQDALPAVLALLATADGDDGTGPAEAFAGGSARALAAEK